MGVWLRQSSTVVIQMGPALDATDQVTEETALSPTVQLSKNGGVFANRNSGAAITHDQNGWYRVTLNGTDTNTLGALVAKFNDSSTHLPVYRYFMVVKDNVYDAHFAVGVFQQVDTVGISGDTAAADNLETMLDGTGGQTLSLGQLNVVASGNNSAIRARKAGTGVDFDIESVATAGKNQIADAVLDRSIAEPTGIFTWAASLRTIIQWLGAVARNKITQTDTTQAVRNDADGADIATSTMSDDGTTFTRGEFT